MSNEPTQDTVPQGVPIPGPQGALPPAGLQALVPAMSTPSTREIEILRSLATTLSKSGLATAKKSPEQTLAIALLGRELGVPIMASLQGIFISAQGQPSFSANLTASLLARGGVTWDVVENTAEQATILFHRKGWQDIESSFTMDEAKLAGLAGKDVWRKYPADLLWARAFTRGSRKIGPDLLAGFGGYTPDELGEDGHDSEFAPSQPASPPSAPGAPEAGLVPCDKDGATLPSQRSVQRPIKSAAVSPPPRRPNAFPPTTQPSPTDAPEEIPPHLLARIKNMLTINGQLDNPLLSSTLAQCEQRLRTYRKEGSTWEQVEEKLEAGIKVISDALKAQIEEGMEHGNDTGQ